MSSLSEHAARYERACAAARARLLAVVTDLDAARAAGRVFTYGQIQQRLRDALEETSPASACGNDCVPACHCGGSCPCHKKLPGVTE